MEIVRAFSTLLDSRAGRCAAACGALAACGFQPLALWPLTITAMAVMIEILTRAPTARRAALAGWLFGVAHFTIGNYWIATAFTYQANMPAWLGWVAVFLISLYLAVYPALAALATWWLARRFGPVSRGPVSRGPESSGPESSGPVSFLATSSFSGAIAFGALFAGCWIMAEWLRSWVFTGFAWNPLGVALLGGFDAQGIAAIAPWTGTYALSGVLVMLAALLRAWPGLVVRARSSDRPVIALVGAALAACVTAIMTLPASNLPTPDGGIAFTLVQPDTRQEDLNDPRQFQSQFAKTARLSTETATGIHRLVLWPESGVPDYLREGYPDGLYLATTYAADPLLARRRIAGVIGSRSLLLTGATDIVLDNGKTVAARNVITAIDGNGAIVASYAKAHLVPYGEYLALRWLLEPLGASRLVAGTLDFLPGPGPRTYDFGSYGRAAMQICYEIIFSGQVIDRDHRPDYIFNPSNDGWFGAWGPPQHLAQARLRAIEEGVPVLRATTTGISAVIDADGIVRRFIPRHTAGRIDGRIPYAHPPTPFARTGNALAVFWASLLIVLSLVALRRTQR